MLPLQSDFQSLLHLPRDQALLRYFDGLNVRLLRTYAVGFGVVAVAMALFFLAEGRYPWILLPVANLLLVRFVFQQSSSERRTPGFRHLLTFYLVAQLAIAVLYFPHLDLGLQVVGLVGTALLTPFFFRLPRSLSLFGGVWAAALAKPVLESMNGQEPFPVQSMLLQSAATAVFFTINVVRMRSEFQNMHGQFQIETSRHRDRMRMRQELDYARQIQLSMLPSSEPKIPGFDISSICLPATEVGGDYYEYFPHDSVGLGIAIADVAGHGVASGLLLSGLRSSLYILQSEELTPDGMLGRLDLMVRATTDRRTFITLLLAVLDPDSGKVVFSSAGHPGPLHYRSAEDRVDELQLEAPPLGTKLEARFESSSFDLQPGDIMVLRTDGIEETCDRSQTAYGDRLARRLRDQRHKSSREIREALLADLWNFKGDAEQLDDMTLIVVKRPP